MTSRTLSFSIIYCYQLDRKASLCFLKVTPTPNFFGKGMLAQALIHLSVEPNVETV